MAYRRSRRHMSRKAGRTARRMSKNACLRKSRRATRKNGLKRGGLSKRVRRGGTSQFQNTFQNPFQNPFHQTVAPPGAYRMPKLVGTEFQPGNPDWQPGQPV